MIKCIFNVLKNIVNAEKNTTLSDGWKKREVIVDELIKNIEKCDVYISEQF